MAQFLRHEPCKQCGSRDNLARYTDGSAWCFGCHYHENGSINPEIAKKLYGNNHKDDSKEESLSLEGTSSTITGAGAVWLGQYDLTAAETIRAGWRWNSDKQQLAFPFYDKTGTLCCIQARNFDPQRASKAKYYNIGNKSESWTIYRNCDPRGATEVYHGSESPSTGKDGLRVLVLCEDAVSSLIVARTSDAMPLLGTHIAKDKLMALRAFYDEVVVWLDADKYREARNIADQAKLVGFKARAIFTELDPKDLPDAYIKELLEEV